MKVSVIACGFSLCVAAGFAVIFSSKLRRKNLDRKSTEKSDFSFRKFLQSVLTTVKSLPARYIMVTISLCLPLALVVCYMVTHFILQY